MASINTVKVGTTSYTVGGNIHAGAWVDSYLLLSTSTTAGATSYSLSSYLPSNSYTYLVAFNIVLATKTSYTSDTASKLFISTTTVGTDTIPIVGDGYTENTHGTSGIFGLINTTKNCTQNREQVILPIDSSRTLYVHRSNYGMDSCYIYCMAYRRIGTNSW